MADVALLAAGVEPTPFQYTVPGAQEIIPKTVRASFDGTGAAGSFVPTLELVAPNGFVLGSYSAAAILPAGSKADVSWFPAGGGGVAVSSGITEITSDTLTVNNGTGPIVDIETTGGGGSITEITSLDDSVTVTDPTGPSVDLSVTFPANGLFYNDDAQTGNYFFSTTTSEDADLYNPPVGISGHFGWVSETDTDDVNGGLILQTIGQGDATGSYTALQLATERATLNGSFAVQLNFDGLGQTYFGATVILMPALPTTDPHQVGQLYNNLGILTISAG